jgi:starch phosphorylase
MKPIQSFTVKPILPKKLEELRDLAYNLWWTWNADARDLFRGWIWICGKRRAIIQWLY